MIKRRDFIQNSSAALLAVGLPVRASDKFQETAHPPKINKPKRLRKGDVVGLIAPGYAITEEQLERSIKAIEAMGMEPYHTPRIFGNHGYLSNTDAERAEDLMHMFRNPKVDAIFCIRGGYGCTRILDLLDFSLLAQHTKILLGYSDITALLNTFYQKIGLIGFHGAMGPELDSYAYNGVRDLLMHPKKKWILENYQFDEDTLLSDPVYEPYVITPGTAKGKLVGGNLSLLSAMNGTDYGLDYSDTIVCIEDVGEAPYRIDRMLTQLLSTPSFKKAAGVVFGVCAGCDKKEGSDSFSLKEVVTDRLAPMGIPALYGMSFGHIAETFTFPIGIEAVLDTDSFSLRLEEKPLT